VPDALPRAWMVGRFELIPGAGARLRRLADPSFDPGASVILERNPGPRPSTRPSAKVTWTSRTSMAVDAGAPGFLVVSETYDPGWSCWVDGRLARLYGVSTKVFNQAIRRNKDWFPLDFAFQLTDQEFHSLRSQFVTLKSGRG